MKCRYGNKKIKNMNYSMISLSNLYFLFWSQLKPQIDRAFRLSALNKRAQRRSEKKPPKIF